MDITNIKSRRKTFFMSFFAIFLAFLVEKRRGYDIIVNVNL